MNIVKFENTIDRVLNSTKTFEEFKRNISRYLATFGFSDWCYERLDIPAMLAIPDRIGTLPVEYNKQYLNAGYYQRDMLKVKACEVRDPVYQSEMMLSVHVTNSLEEGFSKIRSLHKISDLNEEYGFKDCLYIVIDKAHDVSDRALFIVFSKRKITLDILKNYKKLYDFSGSIHKVGSQKFPEHFVHNREKIAELEYSKVSRILKKMISCNLSYKQAVFQLGFSLTSPKKELSIFIKSIGARSKQEAYDVLTNTYRHNSQSSETQFESPFIV